MVDINGTLLAQFLNFFIVVAILAKFAYKPLVSIMEERKQRIAHDLAEAEVAKEEAQKVQEEYKAQLLAARQEAQDIIDKATKQAERTTQQQLVELRAQIAREKDKAQKELAQERKRAMESLRNDVISLSVAIAGKVVANDMNSEINAKLIDEAIDKLNSKTIGL